jgi:hypothetical protein
VLGCTGTGVSLEVRALLYRKRRFSTSLRNEWDDERVMLNEFDDDACCSSLLRDSVEKTSPLAPTEDPGVGEIPVARPEYVAQNQVH